MFNTPRCCRVLSKSSHTSFIVHESSTRTNLQPVSPPSLSSALFVCLFCLLSPLQVSFLSRFSIRIETRFENNNGCNDNVSMIGWGWGGVTGDRDGALWWGRGNRSAHRYDELITGGMSRAQDGRSIKQTCNSCPRCHLSKHTHTHTRSVSSHVSASVFLSQGASLSLLKGPVRLEMWCILF